MKPKIPYMFLSPFCAKDVKARVVRGFVPIVRRDDQARWLAELSSSDHDVFDKRDRNLPRKFSRYCDSVICRVVVVIITIQSMGSDY